MENELFYFHNEQHEKMLIKKEVKLIAKNRLKKANYPKG